jgi:5'-nucleotidase
MNIPKLPASEIKGVKVCKQAHAKWEESFDERVNPHGKKILLANWLFQQYG